MRRRPWLKGSAEGSRHSGGLRPAEGSRPAVFAALAPIIFLIAELFFVVRYFGADAMDGASQLALIFAAGLGIAISMLVCKHKWSNLESAILENIRSIGSAVLILLLIGMISGSWMMSGIVPMMISGGLKVLTPKVFLLAVCVICALVSVMTGSSWTTIATIGVAFVGIGMALGYSPGWTAGAIISGAYFGDKISPLSDTTVLASSSAGTPLFNHIRYMMITTVPSFVLACIVFTVASLVHTDVGVAESRHIIEALHSTFNFSPWLVVVPVLTLVMILFRLPAIITLLCSALLAGIAALIFQPHLVAGVCAAGGLVTEAGGSLLAGGFAAEAGGLAAGAGDLAAGGALSFKSAFMGLARCYYDGTSFATGLPELDSLLETGGMNGMVSTIILVFAAATFGGVMAGSGMLRTLTELLIRKVKGRFGSVAATVVSGIFCNMMTGDQYLSIILTASLYKDLYRKNGLEPRLLSRSTEDSATVTSVLIPWNSCGMTQSTVLKIPTLDYLPYCFFNLISPLMSVIIALVGFRIAPAKKVSTDGE